ncbi:MAG: DUF4127 family protein [Bacilli bacterium]|nr:DUF4127 family protein [Bacilli bacterium]
MAIKVVYIPVDERPCNYTFPYEIFKESAISIVRPEISLMGKKKQPADNKKIEAFLEKETKDAYGLVIALDTLLYGGIVPSRLHYLEESELITRISFLRMIKKNNPKLKIFAFQLIMRSPQYNSSDEEPEYYEYYGRDIFLSGYYQNLELLGLLTEEDKVIYENLNLPAEHLNDFLERRNINRKMNLLSLDFVEDGTIDFMVIPQDDSSEYGYTAMDQKNIRSSIGEKNLMLKVYLYPGADEVGCTLLSRMMLDVIDKKPRIYLKYPSITSPQVIPCLEDRPLDTTIRYQVLAAGGILVPSLADADIVMLAIIGATEMIPKPDNSKNRDLDVLSNLPEIFEFAVFAHRLGYPVIVADLIYLNGGSFDVLAYINSLDLTLNLASYAGWNTSSNSLGTAIAQGINFFYNGKTKSHLSFLIKRYVEDLGYCSYARQKVKSRLEQYGMNYFNVKEERGIASQEVKKELEYFIDTKLANIKDEFTLSDVSMPWKRMFEVSFKINLRD